jgi:uncharacterized membrane protein
MTFESSKTLGGVGAILMLIGFIPYVEPYLGIIALVGLILVLVALHGLANYYKEKGIFNNAIYGLIAGIVGIVVAAAAIVYIVFDTSILTGFLQKLYPSWNGSWSTVSSLSGVTPKISNITMSDVTPILGALFLVLVVLWISVIVAAFFARRSLNALSTKASVGLFSTGAIMLLIGAFLTIIFIGFLVMWIAVLLIAIAFFQMRPQLEQSVATVASPPQKPIVA